jgi:hypothetical protein
LLCGGREWAHAFVVDEAQPIVIYRSVNRDGETFALAPGSLQRLQANFGALLHFRSRVFIGHETRADFEAVHRSIVPQVVQLLTGLSEERLAPLGGVVFRDPATDRDIPLSAA